MPELQKSPRTCPAGVKRVARRRPDGTVSYYFYLRANGARLPDPSSPDFAKALKAAKTKRGSFSVTGMSGLLAAFRRSQEYLGWSAKTKRNREGSFRILDGLMDTEPGDVKRSDLLDLRDAVAEKRGAGAANAFMAAAGVLFAWAVERGKLPSSPALRIKPLPGRNLPAWTDAEFALAEEKLPEHLRRVILLAVHTGQRRGDLISMKWDQYDGNRLRVLPQKANRRGRPPQELMIPAHPSLKAELDAWKLASKSEFVLTNLAGRPFTGENLSVTLPRALAKLGIKDRNVHGLRKLAAARLAEAGCTYHEIASITGHITLAMVQLYTKSANQQSMAKSAIRKLEIVPGNKRENAA